VRAPTGGTADQKVGARRFSYTAGSAGVHHIVIFRSTASEPQGSRECAAFQSNWRPLYAGGPATDPLETPSGVAFPVGEEETWVIQMHYVNAGDEPITDSTTVAIEFTKRGQPFTKAGLAVMGSDEISLPPNQVSEVVGVCDIPTGGVPPVETFAVWPHMHQLGTRFKIEHTSGGSTSTLLDMPWSFGDQPMWFPPAKLMIAPGDRITTTCTYNNTTDQTVGFGESTFEEMCFDFFYYFPALVDQVLPCL